VRFTTSRPGRHAFFAGLVLVCIGAAGSARGTPLPEAIYGLQYTEEDGKALVVVNGKRLSEVELNAVKFLLPKAHGKKGIEPRLLDRLIEQELAIQYAIDRGETVKAEHRDAVDLLFLSHVGMDYYDNHLTKTITFDASEVQSLLPMKWVKVKGQFVVFPSDGEAREAASKVHSTHDFEELKKSRPESVKDTGELFPRSGFFSEFDDVAIFNREKEGFYGALETGIGPAVLYVTDVVQVDAAEKQKLLENAKETVRQRHLGAALDRINAAHSVTVDKANVMDYIRSYRRHGDLPNVELAKVDGRSIRAIPYRIMTAREPLDLQKQLTDEQAAVEYDLSLRNLSRTIVWGEEALRNGYGEIQSPKYQRSFNNLKRRYFLYLGERAGIGETTVGEDEAREYYKENLEKEFRLPDRVRVGQVYSTDRKKLEDVEKKLKEGRSFNHLAMEYSDDAMSAMNGGDVGWIFRNGSAHKNVEKAVFKKKEGGTTPIVKSETGYHIFKVYEFLPARTVPYEEAKDGILGKLTRAKIDREKEKFVKGLKKKAKIEKKKAGLAK